MTNDMGALKRMWKILFAVIMTSLATASVVSNAAAAGYANLATVKPVIGFDDLEKTDLSRVVDKPATIQSTELITTPKGKFCKVLGNIEPTIGFEVDLPAEKWTQRFLMGGCGGLCGMLAVGVTNAGKCVPALNGEFVLAGSDMGHRAQMGGDDEAKFAEDPQKRIDFAYRGNHVTTVVAKALIKAYYGQSPRYSYFMGCSDGGREALMEAQRFPDDYDGVVAGAPASIFTLQNSFYHAWMVRANQRADGTNILLINRLSILHDAVLAKCSTLSGVADGLLQDPRACDFDPAAVQCKAGSNTSKCLTAEEVAVVRKLYAGPTDADGKKFMVGGYQRGSEAQLSLPSTEKGTSMSAGMASRSMQYVLLSDISAADGDLRNFAFTRENFARVNQLAPLYNALNTNLTSFQKRGGKIILWHGWSDTGISPLGTIAYYQGVQKYMGEARTDAFLRMFLLPGVGHCGGGDGYGQVDLLSPIMAWVENRQAPKQLITGKVAQVQMGPPAGTPEDAMGAVGMNAGMDAGSPTGGNRGPYATADQEAKATRPVYAYPMIPRYTGKGDQNDAANYVAVKSPLKVPQVFNTVGESLFAPDNQEWYAVQDGKLIITSK